MIYWQTETRPPYLYPPKQVASNLLVRRSKSVNLNYRRQASQARGKEARNAYQKKRSQAERASLKSLKITNPEAYARLLAEVRGQA
jgi:hypothetical protein